MNRNYVRTAVVIPAQEEEPEKLIATIDSIRRQTRMPMFVRILDYNRWITTNTAVREAIDNLQRFCPNVQVITVGHYNRSASTLAYRSLAEKNYDVLITVVPDVVLRQDAFFYLTEPFYDPNTTWVYGTRAHLEPTDHWWNRLSHKNKISYRLSACRKSVITEFLVINKVI